MSEVTSVLIRRFPFTFTVVPVMVISLREAAGAGVTEGRDPKLPLASCPNITVSAIATTMPVNVCKLTVGSIAEDDGSVILAASFNISALEPFVAAALWPGAGIGRSETISISAGTDEQHPPIHCSNVSGFTLKPFQCAVLVFPCA